MTTATDPKKATGNLPARPALRAKAPPPSRGIDVLIALAMLAVTAAVTAGLAIQLAVPLWTCAALGVTLLGALFASHLLMRRSERMRALSGDLARLEREVQRLRPAGASGPLDAALPARRAVREPAGLVPMNPDMARTSPSSKPGANAPAAGGPAKLGDPLVDERHMETGRQWAYRPADPTGTPNHKAGPPPLPPSAPASGDLDAAHGLIMRLAEQMDQDAMPAQAPVAAAEPESQAEASQLAASIGALRSAADAMRARTDAKATAGAPRPPAPPLATGTPQQGQAGPAAGLQSKLTDIVDAVAAERLDVFLEPILGLAGDPGSHYEVTVRLRLASGESLPAATCAPALRGLGVLPLLDALRLSRTARVAARMEEKGRPGALMSQITSESLGSERFLNAFADAYRAAKSLSGRLVWTLSQADVRSLGPAQWSTLREMAELGFRFALDDVFDLDADFPALKASGFAFVRLDAGVLLQGLPASAGSVIAPADVSRYLAERGMTLIVNRIADDDLHTRVHNLAVPFGQGAAFGAPRPVKPEVLRQQPSTAAA